MEGWLWRGVEGEAAALLDDVGGDIDGAAESGGGGDVAAGGLHAARSAHPPGQLLWLPWRRTPIRGDFSLLQEPVFLKGGHGWQRHRSRQMPAVSTLHA